MKRPTKNSYRRRSFLLDTLKRNVVPPGGRAYYTADYLREQWVRSGRGTPVTIDTIRRDLKDMVAVGTVNRERNGLVWLYYIP